MDATAIAIGRLAELTGIKVTTIRYYEGVGMLPAPTRTEGNRRIYGQRDVDRLIFIRRSRDLGLSQEAIRALLDLDLNQTQPCHTATRIAETHLAEIEGRIAELDVLKSHLRSIIDRCSGKRVESCSIMRTLRGDSQKSSPS